VRLFQMFSNGTDTRVAELATEMPELTQRYWRALGYSPVSAVERHDSWLHAKASMVGPLTAMQQELAACRTEEERHELVRVKYDLWLGLADAKEANHG